MTTTHRMAGTMSDRPLQEDEALQCSMDQVARREAKQKQERSERCQKVRVQQSNRQKARTQVDKFPQHDSNHSDSFDVSVAKKSSGGPVPNLSTSFRSKEERLAHGSFGPPLRRRPLAWTQLKRPRLLLGEPLSVDCVFGVISTATIGTVR